MNMYSSKEHLKFENEEISSLKHSSWVCKVEKRLEGGTWYIY